MKDRANTLCHYTRAEAAFEHILPSGKLRLSPYLEMRDPLESRDLHFFGGGFADSLYEKFARVVRLIRKQREGLRLLSFTVDATEGYPQDDEPFRFAWARARLWEQYADNHAGVCLVFEHEQGIGTIYAELMKQGIVAKGEVQYSPRGFLDTPAAMLDLDNFDLAEIGKGVARFVVDHEHDLFFSKTLDWASEHEYRFTLWPKTDPNKEDYAYVPYRSSLRGVILGEKFPVWQIAAAREICTSAGAPVSEIAGEAGLSRQGVYELTGSTEVAPADSNEGRKAVQYWLLGAGSNQDPYIPPRDDWRQRREEWTDKFGEVCMFGRRPRMKPGDRLIQHAVGSARHYPGENRVFAEYEVVSDPEPSEHPRWRWQVRVRLLSGVPHIRDAPTLGDIDVEPRSVRRQSHIRLSPDQGQRAEALIRDRAS